MKMIVLCCALLSLIGVVSARPSIRFQLRAEDENEDEGYSTDTEMNFDYINAFLAGFRS